MKNVNYLLVLISSMIILTSGCKKTDDNNPSDQTNGKTTAVFNTSLTYGSMTDQDGNTYKTIKIGTQTWMAENLRTIKYRNGDPIPNITDGTQWRSLTTGAYCNYNNDINNVGTYGRLYNWYAIEDSRNVAPVGWHVPTDADWIILSTFLGGDYYASNKLKEIGNTHWSTLNTDATNSSGFTALPGGNRYVDFYVLGASGFWWSSSLNNSNPSYCWLNVSGSYYLLNNDLIGVDKFEGYSVRCLKD